MQLNNATLTKIFEPIHVELPAIVRDFYQQFKSEFCGNDAITFMIFVMPDNSIRVYPKPLVLLDEPEQKPHVMVTFRNTFADTNEDLNDIAQSDLRIEIPTDVLFEKTGNYSVYRLYFNVAEPDESFDQLLQGYFGITKRAPWSRLKEHKRKAETRSGSIVHRAWVSLADHKIPHCPVFRVVQANLRTLDEAYAAEEELVGANTLAPVGLNAIPGGMAGIRLMYQLRMLTGVKQISVEDRNAALDRYIERQTAQTRAVHFRVGHVRRLSSGRNTWVRAHWVNLNQLEAA